MTITLKLMIINLQIIVYLSLFFSIFDVNFNLLQIKPGIAQTLEKDIIFKIPSQVAPNRRQSGSSRSGCPSLEKCFINDKSIFNEDKRLIAAAKFFNQGTELYNKNEFESALKAWQEALQLYQIIPDKELEGKTISNIGLVYYSLGNYALAIEYLEKGATIARQINAKQFEGRTTGNIGLTYDALGKIDEAIKFYEIRYLYVMLYKIYFSIMTSVTIEV
jgi:tetratricopeptide (TPR) repeat protein